MQKPTQDWTVAECHALVDKLNDDLKSLAYCDDIMCIERSPYRTDILDVARVMYHAGNIMPMPAPERWVVALGSKLRNMFIPRAVDSKETECISK